MKISYRVNNLNLSDDIEEILCSIDKKIAKVSKKSLDEIRYGIKKNDNNSIRKVPYFNTLIRYKDIISDKSNNSKCLDNYSIDSIITRAKQILNTN